MINIGEKGYAVILDQNKQIVSHPSRKPGAKVTDPWIKPIYEENKEMSLIQNKMIKSI